MAKIAKFFLLYLPAFLFWALLIYCILIGEGIIANPLAGKVLFVK